MDALLICAFTAGNIMGRKTRHEHDKSAALDIGQLGKGMTATLVVFHFQHDALRGVRRGVFHAFILDSIEGVMVITPLAGEIVLFAVTGLESNPRYLLQRPV